MFNKIIQNLILKIIIKMKPTDYIDFVVKILEIINPTGKEKTLINTRLKTY